MKYERKRLILFWLSFCSLFRAWKIHLNLFVFGCLRSKGNNHKCLKMKRKQEFNTLACVPVTRSQQQLGCYLYTSNLAPKC